MQLHEHKSQLEEAGVTLILVGNGTPNFIEGFRERSGFDGPIFTDPSRNLYKKLGMPRGMGTAMNLRSVRAALRAKRGGNKQTKTQGDLWQQGGIVLLSGQGDLLWSYISEFAGDHPSISAITSALRQYL